MSKEHKECNCREIEKELALSYYSEEDGNTYRLPFLKAEAIKDKEPYALPDGSSICYYEGIILSLRTGNRWFEYDLDSDRGVLTETEIVADGDETVTRYINIFTLTSWNKFSCDPNTYITDMGEELHFCKESPTPVYKGTIITIIDPYGEEINV